MSRLYFTSPSGTAELSGAEFAHLRSVAHGVGEPFWRIGDLDDIADLLSLAPRDPRAGYAYLHDSLDKALAEKAANDEKWAEREREGRQGFPNTVHDAQDGLRRSVEIFLHGDSLPLQIAGHTVRSADVKLNTALRLGNDVIKLITKLAGWGESHAWFDGKDRAWAADLIDEGVKTGVLRDGIWYVDRVCKGLPKDQPDRQWSDMGWGQVTAFLRERDDEPVVTHYSVMDSFPNRLIADWTPPPMPEGWLPEWARDEEERAEWDRDHPDPEDRAEYYDEHIYDLWSALPAAEQWERAMAGLRGRRPWARLGPDTLGFWTFGPGVTLFDLYAADRDERVQRAMEDDEESWQ